MQDVLVASAEERGRWRRSEADLGPVRYLSVNAEREVEGRRVSDEPAFSEVMRGLNRNRRLVPRRNTAVFQ